MTPHNILVLSDVHLGSDLVHHARPDAPLRSHAGSRRDRELVAMLEWYQARAENRPWRLVIAGDFVDFAGMAVSAVTGEVSTECTEEEREIGLGSATDHTIAKLRRVAAHHRDVFAALSRFVSAGHSLVLIRGNHDVDFHWPAVQDEFRQILASYGAPPERVEFADWFYYEEGRVYIEHGHQYDDYCAYSHVLHPVLPSDPRRSDRNFADVLLRRVVRPTRGMRESGHENKSAIDYLRFGLKLGAGGVVALGSRFVLAIGALIRLWWEHAQGAADVMRREHERKMAMLSEAKQISLVKLRALASLQKPPVTKSLVRVLAGVMVDRVALTFLGLMGVLWLVLTRTTEVAIGVTIGAVALAVIGLLWRRARGAIDPSEVLRERATRVCTLLPTALVVMGHTHSPEIRRSANGSSEYVNVGAWAEEDEDEDEVIAARDAEEGKHVSSRTHLVVRDIDGRLVATLMRWDSESGPRSFDEAA